jgi:hypothetical protein
MSWPGIREGTWALNSRYAIQVGDHVYINTAHHRAVEQPNDVRFGHFVPFESRSKPLETILELVVKLCMPLHDTLFEYVRDLTLYWYLGQVLAHRTAAAKSRARQHALGECEDAVAASEKMLERCSRGDAAARKLLADCQRRQQQGGEGVSMSRSRSSGSRSSSLPPSRLIEDAVGDLGLPMQATVEHAKRNPLFVRFLEKWSSSRICMDDARACRERRRKVREEVQACADAYAATALELDRCPPRPRDGRSSGSGARRRSRQ